MTGAAETRGSPRSASRRAEYGTYATGMLTDSQSELVGFIIPLYSLYLGLSPIEFGILVSAKAILPSILAIHGGVLMDRYGTRLVVSLMGLACTLMPPLFSIATWFPALLVLQATLGMVMSFSWMGAQALAVTVGKDDPKIVGRFSFFARVGVMIAPIVAGLMWDFLPHWMSFMAIAVAGAGFWIAVRMVPPTEVGEDTPKEDRAPFRIQDVLPRLSDYIGAIGLLAIPAVAFVVIVSSVRISSAMMQQSFYIQYLDAIGLQATVIGTFIALSQGMAAAGTLSAAFFTRFINPSWVYLGAVTISIVGVYSTPVYGSVLLLLAAVIALRGFAQGTSQPVMYSILSRAVSRETQATSIGLRATGNRVAQLTVPVFLGTVAEVWGLNATFYVGGAVLVSILGGTGLWLATAQRRGAENAPR